MREVEVVDDVKPDPASIKALMEHPTARGVSLEVNSELLEQYLGCGREGQVRLLNTWGGQLSAGGLVRTKHNRLQWHCCCIVTFIQ